MTIVGPLWAQMARCVTFVHGGARFWQGRWDQPALSRYCQKQTAASLSVLAWQVSPAGQLSPAPQARQTLHARPACLGGEVWPVQRGVP